MFSLYLRRFFANIYKIFRNFHKMERDYATRRNDAPYLIIRILVAALSLPLPS